MIVKEYCEIRCQKKKKDFRVSGFSNMPAGIMIPARNMPSMVGRSGNVGGFGSSSGLTLGQVRVCYYIILSIN